jgi:hypothetical protein
MLVRYPARDVPHRRLPVNPVEPAPTLPGVIVRIVESYLPSPSQHAIPVNGSRKKPQAGGFVVRLTALRTVAETGCVSAVDQPHAIDRLHFPKSYA